jgi:hypothetical protein
MVSLLTKVPVEDTLQLLTQHFNNQTLILIRQVLTTTYFLYSGSFYNQREGIAMGLPLAPVIGSFYVGFFELQAISLAAKKPAHWYRHMDNTFVLWTYGKEELQEFLQHLSGIHPNIKFTVEVKKCNALSFLDIVVRRRPDGLLGYTPDYVDVVRHLRTAATNGPIVHPSCYVCVESHVGDDAGWGKLLTRPAETSGSK